MNYKELQKAKETFHVLKDNETRQYGEFRTKRLVLDAWHRFNYDNYKPNIKYVLS